MYQFQVLNKCVAFILSTIYNCLLNIYPYLLACSLAHQTASELRDFLRESDDNKKRFQDCLEHELLMCENVKNSEETAAAIVNLDLTDPENVLPMS